MPMMMTRAAKPIVAATMTTVYRRNAACPRKSNVCRTSWATLSSPGFRTGGPGGSLRRTIRPLYAADGEAEAAAETGGAVKNPVKGAKSRG
jgi:hypothetical protein